jgi:hypothetical protein
MEKYKVLFDMRRVSLHTILLFIEANETNDHAVQFASVASLLRDCLWDIENSKYVDSEEEINKYLSSIRIEEIDNIIADILNQIKTIRTWNAAFKEEPTENKN